MSVNKVILLGRLGQEPELKYTPNGVTVCNFSMATSEAWKDKSGNKQERTEWHRIIVWNKIGETCQKYLHKGSQVYVEGSLQYRSYEKDGIKRYITEIKASNVRFISSKKDQNSDGQDSNWTNEPPPHQENLQIADAGFADDDIPF